MRRVVTMILLGLGGLSLAVALSLGAFALAGNSLREPISPVVLTETSRTSSPAAASPTASPQKHHGSDTDSPTPASSPSETPSVSNPSPSPSDSGGGGGEPGDDHHPGPGHGGDD